jgi:glutamyl-tRNA synthetase
VTRPPPSAGRFAPSPSADLHLGNLRTAVLAWLFARSTGRRFLIRIEDLDDRSRDDVADRQLADLAAIGITADEPPQRQSDHPQRFAAVIDELRGRGLVYECYCSRREILTAPRAPHAPEGAYPGTCRNLGERDRELRRAAGRPPALRLRAGVEHYEVVDVLHCPYTGVVDDFVLRRGDGVAAYNLAVVVDDAAAGVDQVVRGEDLLASTPRQAYLAGLLGHEPPHYAHVPLALGAQGARLAKRDGAVGIADLGAAHAWDLIAESLGRPGAGLDDLLAGFDPAALPRQPWVYSGSDGVRPSPGSPDGGPRSGPLSSG